MQWSKQTPELPDVLDCLDPEVREKLRDGTSGKVSEDVLDCLPPEVRDRIPDHLIDIASVNPTLTWLVGGVAVVAALVCIYKIVKRGFIGALIFGAVAVAALWWWVNNGVAG